MKTQSKNSIFIILIIFISFLANTIHAASYVGFVPETVTQPTGETINLFRSGDIFHNWLHDENNFTVVQDSATGFWCWAKAENGELVSTSYPIHQHTPNSLRLNSKENISTEKYSEKREYIEDNYLYPNGRPAVDPNITDGEFDHIVVFIRFADEDEDVFQLSKTEYLDLLNNGEDSVQKYYQEASYGKYIVESHLFPPPNGNTIASYQSVHPRSYIKQEPSISEKPREIACQALLYIKQFVPSDFNLDLNNDEYIDNITFIFSASDNTKNHQSLWPYATNSLPQYGVVTIHNKKSRWHNIMNEWGVRMTGNGGILEPEPSFPLGEPKGGLIVHEMSHSLGVPDLYYLNFREKDGPVGLWDPMSTGNHYSTSMTAHIKYKYTSWIDDIPWITESGVYTLNPITSPTNNAFRIASPYASLEYFVVEYRNNSMGWMDANIPESGLLVYRVKPLSKGNHHWIIQNQEDFEVYIFRPDGTYAYPYGEFTDIYSATFSLESGRTAINHYTNPSPFVSNGYLGGLDISNIGSAGNTISFTVNIQNPSMNVYVRQGYSYLENYYETIQDAINAVPNEGFVNIYPGVYSNIGNVAITLPNIKIVNITSLNNDPETVIIDCENEHTAFMFKNNNNYSKISNLTIINSPLAIETVDQSSIIIDNVIFDATQSTLSESRAIFIKGTTISPSIMESIITNCIFKGFTNTAIVANTTFLTVNNSIFENNAGINSSAIEVIGISIHIKDNLFINNVTSTTGGTINVTDKPVNVKSLFIINNRFIDNKNLLIGGLSNNTANIHIHNFHWGFTEVDIISNVFLQNPNVNNYATNIRIFGTDQINHLNTYNYINNTEIGFGYSSESSIIKQTNNKLHIKNSIFTGIVQVAEQGVRNISNSWFFDVNHPNMHMNLTLYILGFPPNNINNIFTGNPHLDPITYAPLWNERRKSGLINAANIDTNGNGIPWWEDPEDRKPDGTNLDIGAVQSNRNQKYIKHELERDTYHWVAFPLLDRLYMASNKLENIFQNHHFNNLLSINPRFIDEIEWNYNDISGKVFYGSRGWGGDLNHLIDIKHGYKIKTTGVSYNRPFITSGFYYGNEEPYNQITLQAREAGTSYREIWLGYFGQNGHYVFDLFEDILDDIVEIKTQYWSVSRVPKTPNDWYISDGPLTPNFGEMIKVKYRGDTDALLIWPSVLIDLEIGWVYPRTVYFEPPTLADYTPVYVYMPDNMAYEEYGEIGMFVNDECVGAEVIMGELAQINAYIGDLDLDSGDNIVDFRVMQYNTRSGEQRIADYTVLNQESNTFASKSINLKDKAMFYVVSFKTEDIEPGVIEPPSITALGENYPNPFNPSTTISFDMSVDGDVVIDIYNIRGQKIKTLVDDFYSAGSYTAVWNGIDENNRSVSSGIYFYCMQTQGFTSVRRMMMLK